MKTLEAFIAGCAVGAAATIIAIEIAWARARKRAGGGRQ